MAKARFNNRGLGIFLSGVLALICVLVWPEAAAARQAGGQINLYQDAINHKSLISKTATNYPDSLCKLIDSCSSDGSAPKFGALPPATIDGHKVLRAVFLVKTDNPKEPEAVVFEHGTATEFYFFRIAPDGSIKHTAYGQTGQPWVAMANSIGQPIFDKDKADWHTALNKPGQAAAAPKADGQQ